MKRKLLWIGVGCLAGTWLALSLFVWFYDPAAPGALGNDAAALVEGMDGPGHTFPLLAHGYTKQWSVESWQGDDDAVPDDASRSSYSAVRGPLDPKAGTFAFAVSWHASFATEGDIVRLSVTSTDDWMEGDDAAWTQVDEERARGGGGDEATTWCRAEVPASTTAYRLQVLRQGVGVDGFAQSMLTAPTTLGRFYDAIAWRWPFSWLATLR
ncbi:MAG: hypothetical protein R3F05_19295 [Planctomycetota bacterium]